MRIDRRRPAARAAPAAIGATLAMGLVAAAVAHAAAAAAAADADVYVPVDQPTHITAIAGVIAAGARWQVVFSSVELQDGIIGAPDGGVLIAMQENDVIREIAPDGVSTIYLGGTKGAGALAMGNGGALFAVHRKEPTFLSQLLPDRRVIAPTAAGPASLGRISDLVADLKGGFYLTGASFYYVDPRGALTVLAPGINTNGIALSPDGNTLYVTNTTEVIAFDVPADGMPRNQRVFATLGDTRADGMAVDAEGRVYVPGVKGIHVLSPQGRELGVIPTARRATSLAFAGRDKKMLYMLAVGANRTDGTMLDMQAGPNGRTLYRLPMLTAGFRGRPK